MRLTNSAAAITILLGIFCGAGNLYGDVTLGHKQFSHHSGDGWSPISKGCSATRVHRIGGPKGRELNSGNCPKKLSGELSATFPGPDGSYNVEALLWGKNNHNSGGATYWIKVNDAKIGGGPSATGKCKSGCNACKKASCCSYNCRRKTIASGVSIRKGDKIIFGGTTSWPCGCNSSRGGYYTGFSSITFKSTGKTGLASPPVRNAPPAFPAASVYFLPSG